MKENYATQVERACNIYNFLDDRQVWEKTKYLSRIKNKNKYKRESKRLIETNKENRLKWIGLLAIKFNVSESLLKNILLWNTILN